MVALIDSLIVLESTACLLRFSNVLQVCEAFAVHIRQAADLRTLGLVFGQTTHCFFVEVFLEVDPVIYLELDE